MFPHLTCPKVELLFMRPVGLENPWQVPEDGRSLRGFGFERSCKARSQMAMSFGHSCNVRRLANGELFSRSVFGSTTLQLWVMTVSVNHCSQYNNWCNSVHVRLSKTVDETNFSKKGYSASFRSIHDLIPPISTMYTMYLDETCTVSLGRWRFSEGKRSWLDAGVKVVSRS